MTEQKKFLEGTEDLNEEVVQEISWKESLTSNAGKFLKFEEDEPTVIVITNWKNILKMAQKFENGKKVEGEFEERKTFVCDVLELNGETCDKVLETSSIRFKEKLHKFLGALKITDVVKLNIIRTGTGTGTNFVVQKI